MIAALSRLIRGHQCGTFPVNAVATHHPPTLPSETPCKLHPPPLRNSIPAWSDDRRLCVDAIIVNLIQKLSLTLASRICRLKQISLYFLIPIAY